MPEVAPHYRVNTTHAVIDGDEGPTVALDGATVCAAVTYANGTSKLSKATDFAGKAALCGNLLPEFNQDKPTTGSSITFSRAGYGTMAVVNPKKKFTPVAGGADGALESKWWPAKVTLYGKG